MNSKDVHVRLASAEHWITVYPQAMPKDLAVATRDSTRGLVLFQHDISGIVRIAADFVKMMALRMFLLSARESIAPNRRYPDRDREIVPRALDRCPRLHA